MKENMNPDDKKFSDAAPRVTHGGTVAAAALPGKCLAANRRRRGTGEIRLSGWMRFAALVLRPRFAYATVTALVLAGVLLGTYQGAQSAKQNEQAHYLAAVAPDSLR